MRLFILGGSGMIGTALIKHFSANHKVLAPSHDACDIFEYFDILHQAHEFKADAIINLAALCDMEACERYPGVALRTHAHGSANVALAANKLKITHVYLSSACVFDGKDEEYTTLSPTNPISTYGESKLLGETAARTFPRHIVLRTEWCFGNGPEKDTKFIGKIYRQIENGQTPISAVGDKFGSLSYLPDLAFALERILESGKFGTFHVCCQGVASRYDIAKEFVRLLDRDITVNCVASSFFEKQYDAPRPETEVLVNSVIDGFEPRHWKVALAEYAKQFRRKDGRD